MEIPSDNKFCRMLDLPDVVGQESARLRQLDAFAGLSSKSYILAAEISWQLRFTVSERCVMRTDGDPQPYNRLPPPSSFHVSNPCCGN
jgi:hypothetical protein